MYLLVHLWSFLRVHPDGISVPDLDALKEALTKYQSEEPGSSLEKYERWKSQFMAGHPRAREDYVGEITTYDPKDYQDPPPDSEYAVVRLRSESFHAPEHLPAKLILRPEEQPWKDVPNREVVWVGRYRQDGLPIPGTTFRETFKDAKVGDLFRVILTTMDDELRYQIERSETRADDDPDDEAITELEIVQVMVDLSIKDAQKSYGRNEQGWERLPIVAAIDPPPAAVEEMGEPISGLGFYFYNRQLLNGLLRIRYRDREIALDVPAVFDQRRLFLRPKSWKRWKRVID